MVPDGAQKWERWIGLKSEFELLRSLFQGIRNRTGEFIVGNQDLLELIFIALLSGGHILIEGVPGTAKTTLVKLVARLLGCGFGRVQCAVDTQPADIIGVRIFNSSTNAFEMRKGPIFTNVLLIDEMNRLTPKTQSAFIEAMSERQVTVDGITMPLPAPFFVVATQNPFEFEGTFPLIESQKDRFMFSHAVRHPNPEDELEVITREHTGRLDWNWYSVTLDPLTEGDRIISASGLLRNVRMEESVLRYIRDIVVATRSHQDIQLGASSRASIALVRAAKVSAVLQGRDYVIPDDVKRMALPALQHRILLSREAEIAGFAPPQVLTELLTLVEVP